MAVIAWMLIAVCDTRDVSRPTPGKGIKLAAIAAKTGPSGNGVPQFPHTQAGPSANDARVTRAPLSYFGAQLLQALPTIGKSEPRHDCRDRGDRLQKVRPPCVALWAARARAILLSGCAGWYRQLLCSFHNG